MKQLLKSKIFIGTFLLAYFSFFAITIFILEVKGKGYGEGHTEYGFPFTYYHTTCFSAFYSWSGLIGNILFATIISFISGFVSSYLWAKLSSPEFQVKLTKFRV